MGKRTSREERMNLLLETQTKDTTIKQEALSYKNIRIVKTEKRPDIERFLSLLKKKKCEMKE